MSFFKKIIIRSYIWATEKLYHRFAWAYDFVAWFVSFGNWSKWRKDTLHYVQPGKSLEIGFGTGALITEMTKKWYAVSGLELSPQMIKVTQKRAAKAEICLRILQGKAQALPFPDRSFENVVSTFPSNYIFHDEVLKEIDRVLKANGRVIITGFGVVFQSAFMNLLTGWFLNEGSGSLIKNFCEKVKTFGFVTTTVKHQGQAYTLPIIIMEKKNER